MNRIFFSDTVRAKIVPRWILIDKRMDAFAVQLTIFLAEFVKASRLPVNGASHRAQQKKAPFPKKRGSFQSA